MRVFSVTGALLALSAIMNAQAASGTVRGVVLDPSGAAVPSARVQIYNPVSHYTQAAQTDSQGSFGFLNVPYNNYQVTTSAAGFEPAERSVDVRSPVPVELRFQLRLGAATENVTVEASADLLEADPEIRTDVSRQLFNKLPLESQSSSLSSLVTLATPGVAADSNGLFHGLGDHAENSFSIDGQPITDQQSKVFSNQLPLESVDSMQVIEGAPPAEYGDKTSLVIVATTRSGLGQTLPRGSVTTSFGNFGTVNGGFDLGYGGNRWGNFIAANGLDTSRFLDAPEFQVMHDHGNQANFFDRFDLKPADNDTVGLNLQFTRSWFQTPNSYDMQDATAWNGLVVNDDGLGPNGLPVGSTDQVSKIQTFNLAPNWIHIVNANSVLTIGGWVRQDQFNYYPSADPFADFIPGLQSVSVAQARRLTNLGTRGSWVYTKGIHNIKVGIEWYDSVLTEQDSFGIVDPTFSSVCLNANGTPNLKAQNHNCPLPLQPNPNYYPLLPCYDLTLTGPTPAASHCPGSASGRYVFAGHANVRELSPYLEDLIKVKAWTIRLGMRGDDYDGITKSGLAEPRIGISYGLKPTGTAFSFSYARTLETPFNENLVLSSEGCSNPVIYAIMTTIQGYPCITSPLQPGTRSEYHAGFQQAFGKHLVISGEYIWKYTDRAYDFSVFANSPITFPIEWEKSKIPGFALRASVPNWHGVSAFVVMSSVAARFFEPQVSGIGTTPTSLGAGGVFRIDHDERFNQTTHIQYEPFERGRMKGAWTAVNWRFDSGLVAGAVPCAGGKCANGPLGSAGMVDVSNLTPDQQFEAGLFCGNVYATPAQPISPNDLCPAGEYGSTMLSIPAPGTENNDHNPPRVAPRSLFDVAIGHDNIFQGDRFQWSVRMEVVNLTNADVLYNFLSTFSGTHYVSPRAYTGSIGFHF